MVTPPRILRRAVVVLTLALATLIALAAIGAAQPPTTTTPPTTAPPASSTPTAPTPTGTSDPSAPATPDSSDGYCKGHIMIPHVPGVPGPGVCTPLPSPSTAIKGAITSGASSALSDMVDWVLRGYVWITKYVWQLFININVDASGSTSMVQKMNDMTGELQIVAAGIGLLVALMQILAQRMMLSGDNAAPEAFAGFLRWALAASLAAPALLALSGASDALAHWMFITSAGPEGPTHVLDQLQTALSGRDAKLKTEDVISLVLCVFGLLSLLELAIQLFLQKAWMVYVAVALPIAGAASVTGAGKAVYNAMLRLGVTVLLFKPIAAMLFSVAFWQIRELTSGGDVVTAVLAMAAPAYAMPVLVNLIGNTSVGVAGGHMLRGTTRRARTRGSTAISGGRMAVGGLLGAASSFGRGFADGWRGAGGDGGGSRADARATSSPASSTGNTATRAQQGSKAATAPAPSTAKATQDNRAAASAASTTAPTSAGTTATGNSTSGGSTAAGHTTTPPDPGRTGRSGDSSAGTSGTSSTTAGAANRAGGRSGDTTAPTTAPASAAPPPQTSRPKRGRGEGPRDTTFTRID